MPGTESTRLEKANVLQTAVTHSAPSGDTFRFASNVFYF